MVGGTITAFVLKVSPDRPQTPTHPTPPIANHHYTSTNQPQHTHTRPCRASSAPATFSWTTATGRSLRPPRTTRCVILFLVFIGLRRDLLTWHPLINKTAREDRPLQAPHLLRPQALHVHQRRGQGGRRGLQHPGLSAARAWRLYVCWKEMFQVHGIMHGW